MFFKNILGIIDNSYKKIIFPVIKRGDSILLYLYRFKQSGVELYMVEGIIVDYKKRQNVFSVSMITIKYKMYGIMIYTKYSLNSVSLVGIRVL